MSRVERVTPELLRSMPLPVPDRDTDKNSRGRVLVVGGSSTSPGGALLSGLAALRAGAGKVKLAVPRPLAVDIAVAFPEAGVHPFASERDGTPRPGLASREVVKLMESCDVALVGPGLADEPTAQELTRRVLDLSEERPFVVDALALTALWGESELLSRHGERLVITPHPGEMATLAGITMEDVTADPQGVAARAADHLGCIVVLKGPTTVIAHPTGALYVHDGDCVGLATSGSGDVLAGVLAALISRGASPLVAAVWAVWLHARAGTVVSERLGPVGFLARELLPEIPPLMYRQSKFEERVMPDAQHEDFRSHDKPIDAKRKPPSDDEDDPIIDDVPETAKKGSERGVTDTPRQG